MRQAPRQARWTGLGKRPAVVVVVGQRHPDGHNQPTSDVDDDLRVGRVPMVRTRRGTGPSPGGEPQRCPAIAGRCGAVPNTARIPRRTAGPAEESATRRQTTVPIPGRRPEWARQERKGSPSRSCGAEARLASAVSLFQPVRRERGARLVMHLRCQVAPRTGAGTRAVLNWPPTPRCR